MLILPTTTFWTILTGWILGMLLLALKKRPQLQPALAPARIK